ncbi:hypothetical protein ACOMHN_002873 [Nucella lapillus]
MNGLWALAPMERLRDEGREARERKEAAPRELFHRGRGADKPGLIDRRDHGAPADPGQQPTADVGACP